MALGMGGVGRGGHGVGERGDLQVYPLFAAVGVAIGMCGFQLVRNLCINPEVRASKLTEDKEEPEAVGSASEAVSGKNRKAPITLSLKRVCKVCKGKGHEAGFRGATYIDRPRKPCFLCKMPGHTTISCPHQVAVEHGTFPARCREGTQTHLDYVFERQLRGKLPVEHYS